MKKKVLTKHHYGDSQDLHDDEYYFQKWIVENDITDSDYKETKDFNCKYIFLIIFISLILFIILKYC